MAITGHPLKILSRLPVCVPVNKVNKYAGKDVRVAGFVAAYRCAVTKKKEYMKFVSIMDETGILECVLFPEVYKKFGKETRDCGLLSVFGTIQNDYDKITLIVKSVEKIGNSGDDSNAI